MTKTQELQIKTLEIKLTIAKGEKKINLEKTIEAMKKSFAPVIVPKPVPKAAPKRAPKAIAKPKVVVVKKEEPKVEVKEEVKKEEPKVEVKEEVKKEEPKVEVKSEKDTLVEEQKKLEKKVTVAKPKRGKKTVKK